MSPGALLRAVLSAKVSSSPSTRPYGTPIGDDSAADLLSFFVSACAFILTFIVVAAVLCLAGVHLFRHVDARTVLIFGGILAAMRALDTCTFLCTCVEDVALACLFAAPTAAVLVSTVVSERSYGVLCRFK